MLRAGLARITTPAARSRSRPAPPLVACSLIALAPLAVARRPRRPRPARPGAAALDRRTSSASRCSGLLDDALGRGAAADTPRGWRGHARAVLAGGFSTGAIKAVGALALAAYAISGRGPPGHRLRRRPRAAAAGHQPLQPARPAARPGREGVRAAARPGSASAPGPIAAARAARHLRRPGAGRRRLHPARAGDARRHRLEPGRGARRDLDAGRRSTTPAAGSRSRWSRR